MKEWIRNFETSRRGKAALSRLDELRAVNPGQFPLLRHVVLETCYRAKNYDQDSDPTVLRLMEKWKIHAELPKVLRALSDLSDFLKRHDEAAYFAALQAVNPKALQYFPMPDLFFDRFANALRVGNPHPQKRTRIDGNGQPFNRLGPFVYRRPLAGQKHIPDLARVGLALILILRFRDWTQKKNVLVHVHGRKMPTYGRPCFPQVAALVSATFESPTNEKQIQALTSKLLRRNPGLGIGHFPVVDK